SLSITLSAQPGKAGTEAFPLRAQAAIDQSAARRVQAEGHPSVPAIAGPEVIEERMQTRQQTTGSGTLELTELGFGGAPLGNLYVAVTEEEAQATIDAAWDAGIRVFDTAPQYGFGLSEERF